MSHRTESFQSFWDSGQLKNGDLVELVCTRVAMPYPKTYTGDDMVEAYESEESAYYMDIPPEFRVTRFVLLAETFSQTQHVCYIKGLSADHGVFVMMLNTSSRITILQTAEE